MGKNNRARRAAKARARGRHSQGTAGARTWGPGARTRSGWQPPPEDDPLFTEAGAARALLVHAARGTHHRDDSAGVVLARLESLPDSVVNREAERALLDQIAAIWQAGWQPAELHRQGRLGCSTAPGARLVSTAIAIDHAGRRSTTLDSRWVAQVEGLGLPITNGRSGWIATWASGEGLDRPTALATIIDALGNVMHLPRLEPILPPPGSDDERQGARWSGGGIGAVGAETDPILVRIRALLAQAESTNFEAEATAFTAKAHELMTRHAIDLAAVQGRDGGGDDRPVSIRVPIEAPYADAKSLLLQTVAGAARCRTVFHTRLSMSTVVGFPADVAGVELLFTSLLLQAQTALNDAAKRAPAGTRRRSQSYRSAFLLAYTGRIGDRLGEINDAVFAEAEAEKGSSFLPVLRSRSASVDDYMSARFGEMVSSPVRGGHDAAGWASGRIAADNAQLNFGAVTGEATSDT